MNKSALQQQLDTYYGEGQLPVMIGMRYGNPSIKSALKSLAEQNVYDITTTGSTFH